MKAATFVSIILIVISMIAVFIIIVASSLPVAVGL